MFSTIKKLFGRQSADVIDTPPPSRPVAPVSAARTAPAATRPPARPESPLRAPAPAANVAGVLAVPLASILSKLPADLMQRVRQLEVGEAVISIPLQRIITQLPQGTVKISFGELRQASPPGTFTAETDRDRVQVDVPLNEILSRLDPSLLPRRPAQKHVVVPAEVTGPFGGQSHITFTTAPLKAAPAQPAQPVQAPAAPAIPAPRVQAPVPAPVLAPASNILPFQPARPAVPAQPQPAPQAEPVIVPFRSAPPTPAPQPANPFQPSIALAQAAQPVRSTVPTPARPATNPFQPAAPAPQRPAAAPAPAPFHFAPAAAPAPLPGGALPAAQEDDLDTAIFMRTNPIPQPAPMPAPAPSQPISIPAPVAFKLPTPAQPAPAPAPTPAPVRPPQPAPIPMHEPEPVRNFHPTAPISPIAQAPAPAAPTPQVAPAHIITPIAPEPEVEPAPIRFTLPPSVPTAPATLVAPVPPPPAPVAESPAPTLVAAPVPEPVAVEPQPAPIPAPVPAPTPQVSAAGETRFLTVAIAELAGGWPGPLQQEINSHQLMTSSIALPFGVAETALKQGKIAVPWKVVRSWIKPPVFIANSPNDAMMLELPLKIITPLFLAEMKAVRQQKKVSLDPEIPDLFSNRRQNAPSVPPVPASAAGVPSMPGVPLNPVSAGPAFAPQPIGKPTDTNYFARPNGEIPEEPAPPVKPGPSPGTAFLQRYATPNEIVSKAAALDGVDGAIIALPDGLMVANRIPASMNADTIAGFLPQIFGRVSQCTKELRLGELNNLNFTVGAIPWKIFKVGAIYFAAFGRPGEPLPSAQLAGIAAELDRKAK